MLPSLAPGDRISVSYPEMGYAVGDVVVRLDGEDQDQEEVVHRVVGFQDRDGTSLIVTKGDNSRLFDRPCSTDSLLGRVEAVERRGAICLLDKPWISLLGRWLGNLGALKDSPRLDKTLRDSIGKPPLSSPVGLLFNCRSIVGLLFFSIRWINGRVIGMSFRKQKRHVERAEP